jgi:hypothetical protein
MSHDVRRAEGDDVAVPKPERSTIDGVPLLRGPKRNRAGAAFPLTEAASASLEWSRGDGWTVGIKEGSRYIVASGGTARDYLNVWPSAHAVAQEALDVWSVRGVVNLVTANPYGNHIAFWEDARGSVVRIIGREPLSIGVSATAQVRNAAGEVVPARSPVERWHGSMRFYRTSQVTDDPFEALRSLWLAVENLLDAEVLEKGKDESEEKWLKRALEAAEQHITLASYLPPPSGHDTPKAPHNAAYTYFYDELRVDLFHAKASRQPSLPHNAVAVAAMSERHENLTRLYLDLLNKMTGVTRTGGGGLTYAGFEMATSTLANEARIYLTNELAPFDREETEAAPPGREVAHAPAAPEPQQERPWLRVYLAAIPGADVEPLGPLTRMTLETEGKPAIAILIEGVLKVVNVDYVETQIEVALYNRRQPKHFIFG